MFRITPYMVLQNKTSSSCTQLHVSMVDKGDDLTMTCRTHVVHSNNNKQFCSTPSLVLTKEEFFFLEIIGVTSDGGIPGFSHFWFSAVGQDKLGWDTEIDDQVPVGELNTFLFESTPDATNGGGSKVHGLDRSFGFDGSRQRRGLFTLFHSVIFTWNVRILRYVVLVIIVIIMFEFFSKMSGVMGLGIASVVCNVVPVESIIFVVTKRGWGT